MQEVPELNVQTIGEESSRKRKQQGTVPKKGKYLVFGESGGDLCAPVS